LAKPAIRPSTSATRIGSDATVHPATSAFERGRVSNVASRWAIPSL
jgi:hypothetical protein